MARKRQTEILALIALVLFAYGCSPSTKSKESGAPLAKSSDAKPNKPTQQKSSESVPSRILFEEVQVALGVNHAYQNGEQGKLNFCESFGGGSGWIDYDRDGNWDLYLNQGGDSTQADSSCNPLDQLF